MTQAKKKTQNPYEKLTKVLNTIPNGFPEVEDGTHLRLLEWIYEPDEAELTSKMKLSGETVKKMSKRLKIPEDELAKKLEIMESKGQIRVIKSSKRPTKYGLIPFVVGIYEEQIHRMKPEFAALFEEYVQKTKAAIIFSKKPAIQKVVPVKSVIKTELEIHPYSQAEEMIFNAKSWGIRDCICKVQKDMIDDPCDYPERVCMLFSRAENRYEGSHQTTPITQEDALQILNEAEEAGLIHTSMNVESGHTYICNCCTCCCGVLRGYIEWGQPHAFVKSDYVIDIDEDACIGCAKCIDRCQFGALSIVDKKCVADDKCVGCGVCALVCPKDALSLIDRNPKEIKKTPKNLLTWMLKRAFSRRVNIFKVL
ncbi:MAG: ATP-binding protein [Candidatus Heimdallarchaeaceae archaeon]